MQPTSTSFHAPERRRRTRAAGGALLASMLLLAACGGSGGGGSDGAKATTTVAAAPSTTAKAKEVVDETTTTTEAEPADANAMPTEEDDAPSSDWVMVRYKVSEDPPGDEFAPGLSDVRLYTIEPSCDGDTCDLALSGSGEGGTFNLPDLTEIGGDPLELAGGDEAWTQEEDVEPYGCSADLEGPYIDSHESRAFAPVRDGDGEIVALVGQATFVDSLNAAGKDAGCNIAEGEFSYTYDMVMVPETQLEGDLTFDVNGDFVQSLEVASSKGYEDEERFLAGGQSVTLPKFAFAVDGSCDAGDCQVDVSMPLPQKTQETEMTASDDGVLSVDQSTTSGCYDPKTGKDVFADGAYDGTGGVTEMLPIWVVDGEAQIFLGRYEHTAIPTELGKTHPACSTEQHIEGWVTWVSTDLIEDA